jgi:hypothetical protein
MCASKRGQSTVEYAALAVVIVASLLAMQIYMKRGISGRLRSAADSIGEQYAPAQTTTGTPYRLRLESDTTTKSTLLEDQQITVDGKQNTADVVETTTRMNTPETTSRTGSETVAPLAEETLF